MSTFAIGDVQGCFATLQRLVARLPIDPGRDRLVLAGDLVNRGPRNAETLRWARARGSGLDCVLGNHDLHLLARAAGVRAAGRRDTLDDVLAAPDRDELVDWLRHRPVLVRVGPGLTAVVVHAGLAPSWTVEQAEELAAEVEAVLRGESWRELLAAMQRRRPEDWDGSRKGAEREVSALSYFTRVRCVRGDGSRCEEFSGPPLAAPAGCVPWFDAPGRRSAAARIVHGHWAALGLQVRPDVVSLDTGCVWGGALTAVRLDDGETWQEPLADDVASRS